MNSIVVKSNLGQDNWLKIFKKTKYFGDYQFSKFLIYLILQNEANTLPLLTIVMLRLCFLIITN